MTPVPVAAVKNINTAAAKPDDVAIRSVADSETMDTFVYFLISAFCPLSLKISHSSINSLK
jgi:hypothetical protein